jgi:indolepyruvate decarboxylase
MPRETTISNYLIESLQKVGADHVFGIPGDYVIKFFSELEASDIETVTTCSEQGAAFAADAYARLNGIGALCVTYCVGGLNTVNAVAGAYAEKAPMIVISGAPGVSERNSDYLLHHSIRDLNSQLNIFKEVTVAQCVLDNPQTAAYEIDRVIKACLKYKRPVYIEFPRDMVHEKCVVPPPKIETPALKPSGNLDEALKEAVAMIRAAKKPIILGGVEIRRYKLENEFLKLLESTGYPFVTTILGKSIIDESHPQYLGVYMGKVGEPEICEYIDESDCTIVLGALMTDMNMGTAQLNVSNTIYATADQFCIKHHYFKDIDVREFIDRLADELKSDSKDNLFIPKQKTLPEYKVQQNAPLKTQRFFERLNGFITEDNLVVCDVGDCLFGSATMKLPKNSHYLGPAYYTSMGYGIPATIGVLTKKPELRPVVIVGDGAFQMTGFEVSCFVKYNLKPIIFIVNNKGYTTQRFLKDGSYNNILDWKYHQLPDIFGDGLGLQAFTEEDLEDVLEKAKNNTQSFTIINVHLEKTDCSKTLGRLTSIFGARAAGKS